MTVKILVGDALETLRGMESESVHCCITSPPYFGLRDYGTAEWEGGDEECDHLGPPKASGKSTLKNDGRPPERVGQNDYERAARSPHRHTCPKCGATRIDQQMGLEATPEQFIAGMVEVFGEVRRVLRSDGTCWVNMGDSYATTPPGNKRGDSPAGTRVGGAVRDGGKGGKNANVINTATASGLKPKNLMGMPWRLALALQADGWWLRSDIIWAKPNPMPESVTDRPTKSHEYVFLLTKAKKYFYDADAVREKHSRPDLQGKSLGWGKVGNDKGMTNYAPGTGIRQYNPSGRNKRTVWSIPTQSFPGSHFATFPTKLVEPMIRAGTSERGCCPECGGSWVRVTEKTQGENQTWAQDVNPTAKESALIETGKRAGHGKLNRGSKADYYANSARSITVGWQPTCTHDLPPQPCIVLDIFAGACTVGLVADRLGRDAIMIELSPTYAEMGRKRIADDAGWVSEVDVEAPAVTQMGLFND